MNQGIEPLDIRSIPTGDDISIDIAALQTPKEKKMSETNAVVAVYGTREGAEKEVKELQRAGMDMRTLSIIGKDTHTDEHVVGYYNNGDRMKYWGKTGALWGAAIRLGVLWHSGHRASSDSGALSLHGSWEHWKARLSSED